MTTIVTRGDDAGSCESANHAILEAAQKGVLRNISVMVPGPAFHHAVAVLAELQHVDFGLHVTLNAEWDTIKWGPCIPAGQVPSLLDGDGNFTPDPMTLSTKGLSEEEALLEVSEQLRLARESGLKISYMDTHMGVDWIGELRDRLLDLCEREGLTWMHPLPYLPNLAAVLDAIEQRVPETCLWVTHPGLKAPDMHEFFRDGIAPGKIAEERDQERMDLCDPRLLESWRQGRWKPIRFSEVEI